MKYTYDTFCSDQFGTRRVDTTTNFVEVELFYLKHSFAHYSTHVFNNTTGHIINVICAQEDLDGWRTMLERDFAWKPEKLTLAEVGVTPMLERFELPLATNHQFVDDDGWHAFQENFQSPKDSPTANSNQHVKDPVNPSHYQGFFIEPSIGLELQWLETTCRIQRYRENPEHFIAAVELQVRKYLDRNGRKDNELQETLKGLWYYKFMAAYIKNGKKPIFVREVDEILARK